MNTVSLNAPQGGAPTWRAGGAVARGGAEIGDGGAAEGDAEGSGWLGGGGIGFSFATGTDGAHPTATTRTRAAAKTPALTRLSLGLRKSAALVVPNGQQ